MVSRIKKVRRAVFPTFKVTDARIDPISGRIQAKVLKPVDKKRINIKGGGISTGWEYVKGNYYWVRGKQFKIKREALRLMSKLEATVRIEKYEEEMADGIENKVKEMK